MVPTAKKNSILSRIWTIGDMEHMFTARDEKQHIYGSEKSLSDSAHPFGPAFRDRSKSSDRSMSIDLR